jgi:glycosyltransferase involved in cell wall biosynthesis
MASTEQGGHPMTTPGTSATSISVVVAAYSTERWSLLQECMASVLDQTLPPNEVVLCIDNNEELLARAQTEWRDHTAVVVMPNPDVDHVADAVAHERAHGSRRRFGAGSARNAGIAKTTGDIVAIIDDDARAERDWLEQLVSAYRDDKVVAVGGPPRPRYETRRPDWFPRSFDWVFGCEYRGVPTRVAPYRRLIGANMSMRRRAFDQVGGFQSIDFDDLDMCTRLVHAYGPDTVQWNPQARVQHYVPAARVSWDYFWRRCFFVNVEKVRAFKDMQEAASLTAELRFAGRTLVLGVSYELLRVLRGEPAGVLGALAIVSGLALAASGNFWGRIKFRRAG